MLTLGGFHRWLPLVASVVAIGVGSEVWLCPMRHGYFPAQTDLVLYSAELTHINFYCTFSVFNTSVSSFEEQLHS